MDRLPKRERLRARNSVGNELDDGLVGMEGKLSRPPSPVSRIEVIRRFHPYARKYAQGAEVRLPSDP